MDKKILGNVKPGKFDGQIDIGLKREEVELLLNSLNEKGWVNLRIGRGRESGKPYLELLQK